MAKAHHCPKCGSSVVDYTKILFDNKKNDTITAHGYCHTCKSHFLEFHKTTFVGSAPYTPNPFAGPAGAPVTYGTLEDLQKPKEPDHEMSMFEKIVNEALDAAEAVSEDLRKRKHK